MSSHSVIEPEIVAELIDEDFRTRYPSPEKLAEDDRLISDITGDTIRIEEVDRVEQIGLYVSSQLLVLADPVAYRCIHRRCIP